jgi:phosphatidylglycerol lysyltransferase
MPVEHAAAEQLVLTFFNIAEDELPLFRRFGFQATKWGEEALIDLDDCTWSGHAYEWVRRQSNFCRRHGLIVSECQRERMSEDQWGHLMAELGEISPLFLATKPQARELRLLEGHFDPENLGRRRIFVARAKHGKGRIEGFLACNPCRDGGMWAIETYRQRPDAVRGTVPFLMQQTMQILKEEGVPLISLCLIPGMRCQTPLAGDSVMARWGVIAGTRYLGFLFDSTGAYHFKTRFRPRFENRYLCVHPKVTIGSSLALIRLMGVLHLNIPKLCGLLATRWKKRASRATLLRPDAV